MKFLIGLIIVIALALVAVYNFGGFDSLDPAAQAAQFKTSVKPGMTWDQVADVQAPRKLVPLDPGTFNGERQALDFDRNTTAAAISGGAYPYGFVFKYQFTDAEAYQVIFDETGTTVAVEDLMTARDLFEGKAFKQ